MKFIIFDFNGDLINKEFIYGPWGSLVKSLELKGLEFEMYPNEQDETIKLAIFLNFNSRKSKKLRKLLTGCMRILVVLEPKTVNSKPWQKKYQKKFHKIFYASHLWATDANTEFFRHPQNYKNIDKVSSVSQKINEVIYIGSNNYFIGGTSLYDLRRKMVKQLQEEFPEFKLYGKNWKLSKRKQFMLLVYFAIKQKQFFRLLSQRQTILNLNFNSNGYVKDHFKEMSRSKITIVIENDSTYLSEKLFNAIFSRTIPLYIGPALVDFGVALHYSEIIELKDGSLVSQIQKILNLSNSERNEIVKRNLLDIEKIENLFDYEVVSRNLADRIFSLLNIP